jgi:replicative DNA helicase
MIDLTLLQMLKYRGEFYRIKGRIPNKALDPQTIQILKAYQTYFTNCPEAKSVDAAKLLTIFRAENPEMASETRQAYENIISHIVNDVSEEEKSGVMRSLLELRMGTDIANLIDKWDSGDVPNLHAELRQVSDEFERDSDIKSLDYLRPDLNELLEESKETAGYHWRLSSLRQSQRGLRAGDFGIIAGRPDKGKTTFLASELTHMATQIPEDKTILWLNNEGRGDRIFLRLVQAALGKQVSDIRAMSNPMQAYMNAIKSNDPYKIRIVDIHGQDTYAVENLIRANNPAIVVYDMIDKIRGFGGEARTDLALEEMYSWAREISVKYDAVGLATSQISNEGDNLSFPSLGMLKDSKTGKQGACDFQLMIGALNSPEYEGYRYLGLPKNKLRREGAQACPRASVAFKPQIARFEDLPIESATIT